jgi:hypothetical protein
MATSRSLKPARAVSSIQNGRVLQCGHHNSGSGWEDGLLPPVRRALRLRWLAPPDQRNANDDHCAEFAR